MIFSSHDSNSSISVDSGVSFIRKAICWWIPILYLLVSDTFYLRTYDSAQVKITLLQMGGFSLLGLWASLLILECKKTFSKMDLIVLAPFAAYLAYVFLSFIHVPYHGPSVDDLVRYTLYMSVSLIVIREFSHSDVDRLTKILLITGYISIIYGFIQFIDSRFFPKVMGGTGIDPFLWRQAFDKRVFSTYGNPNFFGNFLVLILPIAVAQFLKKRNIILIPLIILDIICLYATETKGAWMGFAVTFFIFSVFYGYFFLREKLKISRVKFVAIAAIIPVLAFSAVIVYSYLRPSSVSFRVATWLSTWEMAETHPLMGVGVGSFKVIYPAYRRPVIFHIEGRHNTETDHAEQEHLEQFMDNGIIGVGIYLWFILFVTIVGLKALSFNTSSVSAGEKAPDEAYDILGYLSAFLGMLAHNCTDVSMRFVSSGIFLGLLPGVIVNLARGRGLWELHYIKEAGIQEYDSLFDKIRKAWDKFLLRTEGNILLWVLRVLAISAFVYFAYMIFSEFNNVQGTSNLYNSTGERLQWVIAWIMLTVVVVSGTAVFIMASLKARSALVQIALVLSLFPTYYFWGWFKADVDHNLAIYMSKMGKWPEAITYYKNVSKLNPFFIMPYYFVANVFNDRFDMRTVYKEEFGDTGYDPRNDFQRSLDSYAKVAEMAPNYVQLHFQLGVLYLKAHDYYVRTGKMEEAAETAKKAMECFNKYEKLDPVFPQNYYRKAMMYIASKQYDKAVIEYEHNLYAWKCFEKNHMHESAEAYIGYGNALFFSKRYSDAIYAYRKALSFNPKSEEAQHNLKVAEEIAARRLNE